MSKQSKSEWNFGEFPVEALRKVLFVSGVIIAFGSVGLVTGCNRQKANIPAQAPGIVVFPAAGVSIKVGEGWKRIDIDPGLPVCPPTLVGAQGMVRAMLFGPNISSMQGATNALHSMFEANPDASKQSYKHEAFKTANGLTGQHISFAEKTSRNGSPIEARSYNFVIQRKDGRVVAISYIAPANAEQSAVCQMLEETLRLE